MLLYAPLSRENVGLEFDVINIVAPLNTTFWDFGEYGQLGRGAWGYFQQFLNDEVSSALRDLIDLYWNGDEVVAGRSLNAAFRYFGDRFVEDDGCGGAGEVLSFPVRSGMETLFNAYFEELEASVRRAFVPSEYFSELDQKFIDLIDDICLRKNKDLILNLGELTDTQRSYLNSINFTLDFSLTEFLDGRVSGDRLRERASWVAENYPLHRVEVVKDYINMPHWGREVCIKLRNSLRLIFDEHLSKVPMIQTNPYECA